MLADLTDGSTAGADARDIDLRRGSLHATSLTRATAALTAGVTRVRCPAQYALVGRTGKDLVSDKTTYDYYYELLLVR